MPEAVIREAIQLISRLTDLKSPLQADETVRVLYEDDFRDKAKIRWAGRLCRTARRTALGRLLRLRGERRLFSLLRSKGQASKARTEAGIAIESLGSSGATSVGGILAPIKGAPVTSLFGMRFHPILHILRLHAGIDFGAPVGSPVRAAADGKVEFAGPVSGFGNHVRIQHKGFETSYSHLSEIPESIKPGADVKEGEIIALSGNTGLSTGPHLHFEFYLNRRGGRSPAAPGVRDSVRAARLRVRSAASPVASSGPAPGATTPRSPRFRRSRPISTRSLRN